MGLVFCKDEIVRYCVFEVIESNNYNILLKLD